MTAFKNALSDVPPEWRGLSVELLTTGLEMGVNVQATEQRTFRRESALCGIGLVLILLAVVLTFTKEHMNAGQSLTCCILYALGAAAFLVFLPGFLTLKGKMQRNAVFESLQFQGGGGAAIFIIVFFLLHYVAGF